MAFLGGKNAGKRAGIEAFNGCVSKITLRAGYSTPCASMASATLTNPAILAPCT
ncbi:hypothetical protein Q5A_024440 [Serratia inhibens PRI-2C]|nr:hypothetical protein Q5A_024440 [Serratia inhibens PRI-2C]